MTKHASRFQILLSQLLTVLFAVSCCDARSTKVSAQYTVADGNGEPSRTFGPRGIVEDAVVEDGGILTKLNSRPTRVNRTLLLFPSSVVTNWFTISVEFSARTKKKTSDEESHRAAFFSTGVLRRQRASARRHRTNSEETKNETDSGKWANTAPNRCFLTTESGSPTLVDEKPIPIPVDTKWRDIRKQIAGVTFRFELEEIQIAWRFRRVFLLFI